ncbi:MAG TPA: Fic family protein, partial [Chitinophagales bacterium]|nr:Fic family protein [Chitinophagales bacterium]
MTGDVLRLLSNSDLQPYFDKAQHKYYPWEKVKYLKLPDKVGNQEFWHALKLMRTQGAQIVKFGKYVFRFNLTPYMQKTLHEFDMNYGRKLGHSGKLNERDKHQYLIGSIMEEAIASSKIEGAVTTRKIAKEMLRQNRPPVNKSERMILNNYVTISRIRDIVHEPLTEERILEVQKLMTHQTLDNREEEGRFRIDNRISVVDTTDGAIMHQPPSVEELDSLMTDVYTFFNNDGEKQFIHPIIKAGILHFIIGFIHPFADGNGRTARALFYWFMLKKGYWLTEYLSISGVILKSKTQYGMAFLYTENDELDLTYFLNYKMGVLRSAYDNLQQFLQRKIDERNAAFEFMQKG